MQKSSWSSPILLACSLVALAACCYLGSLQTGLAEAAATTTTTDGANNVPLTAASPPTPPSENLEILERNAQEYNQKVRTNFKLPKMFDFDQYKRAFNKHYKSAFETMIRMKVFMANAYRAFISAVKYKYRKATYYLGVNSRSDWTPEELEASRMKPGTYENSEVDPSASFKKESNDNNVLLADPEEVEAELKRIEQHANEPGYRQLAAELKSQLKKEQYETNAASSSSNLRKKRAIETAGVVRDNFSVDQAFNRVAAPTSSFGSTVPKERNPNYLGPELASQLSAEERASQISFEELANDPDYRAMEALWAKSFSPRVDFRTLPVKSNYKLRQNRLNEVTASFVTNQYPQVVVSPSWWQPEPDIVWVDHRRSGCMFPVGKQGRCGSCYTFSTIAFFEWAYCMETGSKTKFSEQYIVDCGKRLQGLDGCDGGNVLRVARFVNNFGLELERNYPYKAREEMCGYPEDVPMTSRGYIRLNLLRENHIWSSSFEHYLIGTPIVTAIAAGGDFELYGGGVWDGANCGSEADHSILLVGHGREDGEEYWLVRNSYGEDYGEAGHIKVNKNTNCISPSGMVFGDLSYDKLRVYASDNSQRAALINSKN